MTESRLREQVISTLRGWVGWSETNGGHRRIVDIYNGHRPLAQGYPLKYTDAWCAATVSAAAIVNGITDIMPTECSCPRMIQLYQALGRWQESDAYRPQPGDLIMYDWEDSGKGDDLGSPNHVGVVESVKGDAITVLEGNYRNAVGRRTVAVDGRYIRGYCLPDYAAKAAQLAAEAREEGVEEASPAAPLTRGDVKVIVLECLEELAQREPTQDWQRTALEDAKALGITDGSQPMGLCLKVHAAQMAVNAYRRAVCDDQ